MSGTETCHVCGGINTFELDRETAVHKCGTCGHAWSALSPEKRETYSPEYFYEVHKRWFKCPDIQLFRRIDDVLLKEFPLNGVSVLDVGCGKGDFLRYLSHTLKYRNLTGIDLVSNSHPGITFLQGEFNTYPFLNLFDAVTGLMVIEHIADPHGFVAKLKSVLKLKGVAVINTINAGGLLYTIARCLRVSGITGPFRRLYDRHHLEHYSSSSLRNLLKMHGFEVIWHRTHNFPLKAVDVPEGNRYISLSYRLGIATAFILTSFIGGVRQTLSS